MKKTSGRLEVLALRGVELDAVRHLIVRKGSATQKFGIVLSGPRDGGYAPVVIKLESSSPLAQQEGICSPNRDGLQVGDVVLTVNGQLALHPNHTTELLINAPVGDVVLTYVKRDSRSNRSAGIVDGQGFVRLHPDLLGDSGTEGRI